MVSLEIMLRQNITLALTNTTPQSQCFYRDYIFVDWRMHIFFDAFIFCVCNSILTF